MLSAIKEPINLYFFFSERAAGQLPQLKTYGLRVREFLEELVGRSNGKLRLHVIDPQPFSEEEDRASELGVRGASLGATGGQFYFGLAGTNSTDGHAAIEFFDPNKEQFLEYDVVKLVYELANPKKPVVAWMSSLPMGAGVRPAERTDARAVGHLQRRAAALRSAAARSDCDAHRPRCERAGAGAPEGALARHAVRHRSVRAARWAYPRIRRPARRGRPLRSRAAIRWPPWGSTSHRT